MLHSGMNFTGTSIFLYTYAIRDLVGNNNNSIANCIFYLTKEK